MFSTPAATLDAIRIVVARQTSALPKVIEFVPTLSAFTNPSASLIQLAGDTLVRTVLTGLKSDGNTIPASGNGSPAALTVNTWGYNTTGSTSNFKGITTSPVSIDTATGPYKNGRDTTVTYGTLIDGASISGTYTVNVTYTAIGQT